MRSVASSVKDAKDAVSDKLAKPLIGETVAQYVCRYLVTPTSIPSLSLSSQLSLTLLARPHVHFVQSVSCDLLVP